MLITSSDTGAINKLKQLLNSEFEMKDLGAARRILGMEIVRKRSEGLLFLYQSNYVEKVLRKFNMLDAKNVSTPIAGHFKLSVTQSPKTEEELKHMTSIPYTNAT